MPSNHGSSRPTMHIPLPPRLSYTFSQDSDASALSTTSPNTPLPYNNAFSPSLAALHQANGSQLDRLVVAGVKRSRVPDETEVEWTDEEIGTVQAALLHPYRPLSASYPPGELPPPNVLDEIASQIISYAYADREWLHSLDDTRKKLFQLALAESKLGQHADRHATRDKHSRPGLRRMDSMDFLDERSDDDGDVGRTMRLSTSLQNSAKLGFAGRQGKASSPIPEKPASADNSVVLTITPASPDAAGPALRRQRSSRTPTRLARPSLLQRGRSFTADDLAAEAQREHSSPRTSRTSPLAFVPDKAKAPIRSASPRMTRSASSSALITSHPARDRFMTHVPSTSDPTVLAMPLSLTAPKPKPANNSWSDSEDDDCMRRKRTGKKIRSERAQPCALIQTQALKLGGGLRSPFNEHSGGP